MHSGGLESGTCIVEDWKEEGLQKVKEKERLGKRSGERIERSEGRREMHDGWRERGNTKRLGESERETEGGRKGSGGGVWVREGEKK